MKIVSVYDNFINKGGAQDILLLLAKKLNTEIPVILTTSRLKMIHPAYQAQNVKFMTLNIKNILNCRLEQVIFLSHQRKLTSFLVFLNIFLIRKLFIVHIAHNTFTNLRCLTLFPQNIIAVSYSVKKNLIDYFRLNAGRITVIYNGIDDISNNKYHRSLFFTEDKKIRILLIGRLCKVKQQVELVNNTKGLLNSVILFYFAGEGDMLPQLKKAIGYSDQYRILGHIDIKKELYKYDYICLFSEKEGLGVSLVEGCMFGKPLITNDLESVQEVNINNYNGFVVHNWAELIVCINSLPTPNSDKYRQLSFNARKQYIDIFTVNKMLTAYNNALYDIYYKKLQ
jgi:glycosyltransferase involved in cell wall biosynthesis